MTEYDVISPSGIVLPGQVRRIVERPLVVEYAKAMAAGGVDAKRLESVWDDYRRGVSSDPLQRRSGSCGDLLPAAR